MFISNAFAQDTVSAVAGAPVLGTVLQIVLIFLVFYLLLIRPQQKKMKQHEAELQAIKISDKVMTAGGLYAVVKGIDGDDLTLEIAKGVDVKAHRYTIREVLTGKPLEQTKSKKQKS